MSLSRRHLIQGIAGLGAGLLLAATVEENAEAVERVCALPTAEDLGRAIDAMHRRHWPADGYSLVFKEPERKILLYNFQL